MNYITLVVELLKNSFYHIYTVDLYENTTVYNILLTKKKTNKTLERCGFIFKQLQTIK